MKPEITGQVIVRETGAKANKGRKLIIVCGIIAVPDDAPIEGEHQYVLSGKVENGRLDLALHTESGNDLTQRLRGMTPSQWLTDPIWRY